MSRQDAPRDRTAPGSSLALALPLVGAALSLASLLYTYRRQQQQQQLQPTAKPPAYTIRVATPDQLDALITQSYLAFDDDARSRNREGKSWLPREWWVTIMSEFWSKPRNYCLVAVSDTTGEIMGSVVADNSDDGISLMGPFSVATQYSNAGIARKLVQQLIDDCQRDNPQRALVLMQEPVNVKPFALYSKLGFRVQYNCTVVGGFITNTQQNEANDNVEVKRFTHADLDQAAELLQKTLSGVSRRNFVANSLNPQTNTTGIGYVARSKSSKELVGFTTAANTFPGFWCYTSPGVFKALYTHAHQDLQTYNDAATYSPMVWMPQLYYEELEWLLSCGVKVQMNMNGMVKNTLTVSSEYRYCPSFLG